MEFSVDEMTRRLDTVRKRMDAARVDCLLVSGPENFSYFTGVPASIHQTRRPSVALIPLAAEPVALMKEGPVAFTQEHRGFFRNVQGYPFPVSRELPRRVADLIAGTKAKRVACEFGLEMRLGMPLADFNAIMQLTSGVEFVDGADIIWSLRMTKSPEEAARMKKACEITGSTRQRVFELVKPGMTEADVAELWANLMHEAGAERPSFIYVNTGKTPDLLPSRTKKLQRGETLWLDGGAYVGGYTCDFSRVATLGRPSERQEQLHRDAVEITGLLLEQIRPGVPVTELSQFASRELTRRGYGVGGTGAIGGGTGTVAGIGTTGTVAGHSMGMLINEPPMIAPWDKTVLSEGLVLGIELGPVTPDGMFIWEHLVQVTSTGHDLFTTEPSTLVSIDF